MPPANDDVVHFVAYCILRAEPCSLQAPH